MIRRLLVVMALVVALPSCMASSSLPPECNPSSPTTILLAQSVPSATRVPCLRGLPLGWSFAGMRVTSEGAELSLGTDTGWVNAVTITFSATCDVGAAVPVEPSSEEAGSDVFLEMTSEEPIQGVRFRRFEGGCITSRYSFPPESPPTLVQEADDALSHVSRFQLVHHVEVDDGGTLCGAVAPPCLDG